MNYIELINRFWQLRRSKRITSKETDLYFFLVQECNTRSWENPFQCSNKLIIASIDIKEPTLIEARNKLKQLGLIEFIGGEKNVISPVYTIIQLGSNLNNLSKNHSRNRDETIVETEMKAELLYKLNKTKQKEESGGKPPTLPKSNLKETLPNRKNQFYDHVAEFKETYPKEMLRKFYDYWSELNPSGTKMKFELQKTWELSKRLATWSIREKEFIKSSPMQQEQITTSSKILS